MLGEGVYGSLRTVVSVASCDLIKGVAVLSIFQLKSANWNAAVVSIGSVARNPESLLVRDVGAYGCSNEWGDQWSMWRQLVVAMASDGSPKPRTREPEASMRTTRPPKPSKLHLPLDLCNRGAMCCVWGGNSMGLSPRANYTDRTAAAGRRS
jgi:hypothetical protein